jgi:hypothetical protein
LAVFGGSATIAEPRSRRDAPARSADEAERRPLVFFLDLLVDAYDFTWQSFAVGQEIIFYVH